MVKQLSSNRLTQYESYKYLKKININKFGIARFKEWENLKSFLIQAKTQDLLEFEYNEVNNHLERLFIITNSMKNTYK